MKPSPKTSLRTPEGLVRNRTHQKGKRAKNRRQIQILVESTTVPAQLLPVKRAVLTSLRKRETRFLPKGQNAMAISSTLALKSLNPQTPQPTKI